MCEVKFPKGETEVFFKEKLRFSCLDFKEEKG